MHIGPKATKSTLIDSDRMPAIDARERGDTEIDKYIVISSTSIAGSLVKSICDDQMLAIDA